MGAGAVAESPLVYVVTPVHNGEPFLEACIQSVLSQNYTNWRYAIVNNQSTDRTREIAAHYAQTNPRITVHDNVEFLDIIANWNHAMRLMPPGSKYCKVVHADDILFPECVQRMVDVAETDPRIAVVGAYVLQENRVVCDGRPYPRQVFSGAEVCRSRLHGATHVFGTPTTTLIRADIIRKRDPFYDDTYLHADAEACLDILRDHDWGYVHQVLTHTGIHRGSVTAQRANPLQTMIADNMRMLLKYGPEYFSAEELPALVARRREQYYYTLAKHLVHRYSFRFVPYQRKQLAGTSEPFSFARLAIAAVRYSLRHPLAFARFARIRIRRLAYKCGMSRPKRRRTSVDANPQQARSEGAAGGSSLSTSLVADYVSGQEMRE